MGLEENIIKVTPRETGRIKHQKGDYQLGMINIGSPFILYEKKTNKDGKTVFTELNLKTAHEHVEKEEEEKCSGRIINQTHSYSDAWINNYETKTLEHESSLFHNLEEPFIFYQNKPIMPVKIFNEIRDVLMGYWFQAHQVAYLIEGDYKLGILRDGRAVFYNKKNENGKFGLPLNVIVMNEKVMPVRVYNNMYHPLVKYVEYLNYVEDLENKGKQTEIKFEDWAKLNDLKKEGIQKRKEFNEWVKEIKE